MSKIKDNKARFQFGTGITSIIMIFVVLCLTTFGILSYSTARMDENYAKKSYESFEKDCAAVNKVETLLYNIDAIIAGVRADETLIKEKNMEAYLKKIEVKLKDLAKQETEVNLTMKNDLISFRVNIDKNNAYDVQLVVNEISDTGLRYTLNKYKVIYINDWNSEDVWRWN